MTHSDVDAALSLYRAAVKCIDDSFYNVALRQEWAGRTEDEFLRQSETRDRFVAEHDGRIAGYIGYQKSQKTLTECYIDPPYQSRGIGRRLVEYVCRLAVLDKVDRLTVLSSVNARNFYERLGFVLERQEDLLMGDGQFLPCYRMYFSIQKRP